MMIQFNYPSFFSIELNRESVYKNMLYHTQASNTCISISALQKIIDYIKLSHPFGISLYGNLDQIEPTVLSRLFTFCKKNSIQVGYDLNCNEDSFQFIKTNISYIQLFRVLIFSLDKKEHGILFSNNKLCDVQDFMENLAPSFGRVAVIPVTHENLMEVDSIISYAFKCGFRVNPLPLPNTSAVLAGLTPLSRDEYKYLASIVRDFYSIYGEKVYFDMPAAFGIIEKTALCPAFRLSVDITCEGMVRSCKFSNEIHGDIECLHSIWKNKQNIVSKKCMNCSRISSCGGGCMANHNSAGYDHNCPLFA